MFNFLSGHARACDELQVRQFSGAGFLLFVSPMLLIGFFVLCIPALLS